MFINIPCRTSDCVERMVVLIMNPNMSLGFWVNENLLPFDCKSRVFGECTVLRALNASDLPITDNSDPAGYVYCNG